MTCSPYRGPLSWIEEWALDQPLLAHVLTVRARQTGVHEQTRPRIKAAMRPQHWGFRSTASAKNSTPRSYVPKRHATDPELIADFEEARAHLQKLIDGERRDNDEDDEDDDW
jgi:hypothetical protein